MKYCTNCQAYKESWVDKGYSSSNYENRCWSCDNYSLTTQSQEIARRQNEKLVTQATVISEGLAKVVQNNPNVKIEYKADAGVRYETNAVIEYQSHTLTFMKK